jgi:hypothetical protein
MSKDNGNGHENTNTDVNDQVKEILDTVNKNSFDSAFHSDAGFNAVKTLVEPKDTLQDSAFLLDLDDPQLPSMIAWQNEVFEKYGLKDRMSSLRLNMNLRSSVRGKRVNDFLDGIAGERTSRFKQNQFGDWKDKVKKFSNFGDGENK